MRAQVLLVPLLLPGFAEAARPITHEDLWRMPRLSAPVASGDGRLAILTVVEPAYAADEQVSDLWLVTAEGGAPRRLTSTRAPEGIPALSRDGRWLAFSSQRDGDKVAQVYLLDLEQGGDARRATMLATATRTPQISPDGSMLAFVTNRLPGVVTEEDSQREEKALAERRYNARVYTEFPIRNWDRWLDDRQPRLLVAAIGASEVRDLLAGTALLAEKGFGGRMTEGSAELDPVFAPDGKALLFNASIDRHVGAFALPSTQIYQVPVTGGEPVCLSCDWPKGIYGQPRFSADGKTLLVSYSAEGSTVYRATEVALYSWPGLKPKGRVGTAERLSVAGYVASADASRVWFTAEQGGHEQLFVGSPGKPAQRVSTLSQGLYTNLVGGEGARGMVLYGTYESASQPAEFGRIDPARGAFTPKTRFAAERAAELDLPPAVPFTFTSSRGRSIHSLLIRPAGFDPTRRYPLFVLIHGGPHTMWRDQFVLRWNYHLLAGSDYVLLLTNYSGSTGFGEAFAQAIHGDPLEGPGTELVEAAEAAISRYAFLDGERQCAGGASYGGHLANWLQATTRHYRCLISHAGLVSLQSQWLTSDLVYGRELGMEGPPWVNPELWIRQSPSSYIENFRTPTLVTIGENDFRVPINNAIEYWSMLKRQRVESRLVVFPDENHWILKGENSRYFYQEVKSWLDRWLLAPATTEALP